LKVLLVISVLAFYTVVQSQQWVEFTQQDRYGMYQNPSMAGKNNMLDATVAHRSQYIGLSSKAISTQYLGFSMPVLSNKLGVGMRVVNDQIGYQRYTSSEISLAYHMGKGKLRAALGLSAGLVQMGIDGSLFRASGGNYSTGTIIHNDEFLPNNKVGALSPNFSAGALFYSDILELGATVQNLNSPQMSFDRTSYGTFIDINRTINLHARYNFLIGKIRLIPGVFYKTDFVKHQILSNFMVETNNIFFGVAFRGYSGFNNDAVAGILGFRIKRNLSIAYSYDFTVSSLNNSSSGSHEISIRYENLIKFKEKSRGNIMHNPRFL
jgi:type IX secretion system PorP/SprF family membrane protein